MAKTISKRSFFAKLDYIPHTGQEQIHAAVDRVHELVRSVDVPEDAEELTTTC